MKSSDVRSKFIQFFESKHHQFVKSAPILPQNDPTLLFVNAGMNQFKDIFLGKGDNTLKRAVNSQVCVRVSGKHNDLEEVGLDTYHQTLFEMLGNWSFGDYYKKEAIEWAWELLTEGFGLPKDKLYATVYEEDEEAFELWTTHTDIHPTHVVKCGKKDNFWEMGETGPCGPCSEIHIDTYDDTAPQTIEMNLETGGLADRYMELWNLVFIQYNRNTDGSLEDLPQKHVDTGAGLERITAYLQGVNSNYDTDLFKPIIDQIVSLTKVDYHPDIKGMPHRVMADHIRTLVFGIADTIRPSNEGRGYVLRRLLRRALRYAQQLGVNTPILHHLVPTVISILGTHFDHLAPQQNYIERLIKAEEESFLQTLSQGIQRFDTLVSELKSVGQLEISGADAFKLYDTYGFPIDLTQVMASEQGFTIDMKSFQLSLDEQKDRSRQAGGTQEKSTERKILDLDDKTVEPVHVGVYKDAPGGGEAFVPSTDLERFHLARHHTATHLLHEGLRHFIGDHVHQAGSLVDVNRLRFDYTHFDKVSKETLKDIETWVNDQIAADHPVIITEEPIEAAKSRGAIAMFGEKYGDTVRVVEMPSLSIELCGGNHVTHTKALEVFKLVSDGSISTGTRRIEAIVGTQTIQSHENTIKHSLIETLNAKQNSLHKKAKSLSSSASYKQPETLTFSLDQSMEDLQQALTSLTKSDKALDKAITNNANQASQEASQVLKDHFVTISDTKVLVHQLADVGMQTLRQLSDQLIQQHPKAIIALGSSDNGKGLMVIKISKDLSQTMSALSLMDTVKAITGGGGGGREDMAQAGGLNADKLSDALTVLEDKIKEELSNPQ